MTLTKIKIYGDRSVPIDIDHINTIGCLKEYICYKMGLKPGNWGIYLGNKLLDDNIKMSDIQSISELLFAPMVVIR